jgi:hypothetical protein
MTSRARNYVPPYGTMWRAAAYNEVGECVRAIGPYATRGPAMSARGALKRAGLTVVVESCYPFWVADRETEVKG